MFAQGDKAKVAQEAGADIVGFDDLAAKIKGEGFMEFDVVIATPDAMKVVGQLGQILGPRGLMPNPKVGTVTPDVATAVKNARAGQVQYRTDKAGIVQCTIGRASFAPEQLKTNLLALVEALNKAKPQGTKGIYLKKVSVSSTMGAGVRVDTASLTQQTRGVRIWQSTDLRERGASYTVRRAVKDRGSECLKRRDRLERGVIVMPRGSASKRRSSDRWCPDDRNSPGRRSPNEKMEVTLGS